MAFLPPSLEERGYLLSKGFTINYNSDNGKPTFETDQNGNAIIHLHHKKITSSKPKTITRTINITEPGQETKTTVQAAQIYRDVTVDKVTNGVTYGDWSTDANDWAEVDVPSYIGYTPSQTKVDAVTVKDGQKNVTVNITYTANTQTGSIVYVDVDNNVEVGHTDLTGKTDQSVTITPAAPAGYDIVAGQNIPNSEVATATGIPTVTVKVSHHKITVTPGQEPKPGDKIPGNPDKKPGDGTPTSDVSYETLHRNMTRTINVKDPHTGLKATKVTIHYERTATIDDVTGDVTYGTWSTDAKDWTAVEIPVHAGYTVHQSDNKSGVPTVTVKVQHHKIVKTPNDQDLKNLGDMIPANPSKKPGDGTPNTAITHSGLVRDMTRTITINAPANHVGTTTNNMTL